MKQTLVALVLLSLLGCGNKQEAPRPVAAVEKAEKKEEARDDRPVMVAFGDSLTAGYGLEPGQSYPDELQRLLDGAGKRFRVVNEGLSGDTTGGGVSRVESVLGHKPAIVILELGGNDGLRGIPVATTRANLDEMLGKLKAGGAKVLLAGVTLPRNYGADYIREFDRIYPELAKKHKTPLMPFVLEGVALHPELMQGDALHPNAAGAKVMAQNIYAALAPLLDSK